MPLFCSSSIWDYDRFALFVRCLLVLVNNISYECLQSLQVSAITLEKHDRRFAELWNSCSLVGFAFSIRSEDI